jgi:hypothetical protein
VSENRLARAGIRLEIATASAPTRQYVALTRATDQEIQKRMKGMGKDQDAAHWMRE